MSHQPDRIAAALPVRSFSAGKSRLASMLAGTERHALIVHLLAHVATTLERSNVIARLAVVSDDPAVLGWAKQRGLHALPAQGEGLDQATKAARDWAMDQGADALLIALPDLPLLTPDDVRSLIALSRPRQVVLAPERHGSGTNAILLRPPDCMPCAFGPNSLAKHRALAHERQLDIQLARLPGWAFDLDTPADLIDMVGHDGGQGA